jgi:uncharacterized phage protein gp47/JayE
MAAFTTKNFSALVSDFAAAVQSASSMLVDFSPGSILLATGEAVSGVALWLQGLVLTLLGLTRAATSTGADLDSWMADFSFARLAATFSTGPATFSRFTATQQAVVPVGASVQTQDGTQAFTVTIDTTNAAYSAALGGYVLPPGASSVTVPVMANAAGSGGNVLSGAIATIAGAIPGIDTVTNAAAFTNGVDAETDPSFLVRFALYIASLSKATKVAVASAAANVQQGLVYTITENADYNGTPDYGFFYVVVDDGSGTPPSTLIATVANAIDAVRGLTIRFGVFAPVVVTATPAMTITSAAGFVHAAVVAAVGLALQTAINALPLGVSLPYTQLSAIAYSVAGVTNASSITLNGGTADLTATAKQVIKCGNPVVA